MGKRIYFVDFARSFAIVLALFDHSMNDFHVWENYSFLNHALVKSFTSSATPTFLFLFGMMLEIIYLRRLKKYGFRSLSSQLIFRSFQCYIGYAVTAVAGYFGGILSAQRVLAALLFVGNTHFGNILKLYTLMLLLAVPLLWLREKKGIKFTMMLILSYWLVYPLFQFIPPIQSNIDILTSYFFGFGGQAGPSVLHALTIVVAGMFVAGFISFEKPASFYKKTGLLLLIFVVLLGTYISSVPLEEYLYNVTFNIFRNSNSPVYFILGISLALISTIIFSILVPLDFKINKKVNYFLVFGRSSLLSFTLGNVLLNLGSPYINLYEWNYLAPTFFVITVFIMLKIYENYLENMSFGHSLDQFRRKMSLRLKLFYIRPLSNWMSEKLDKL